MSHHSHRLRFVLWPLSVTVALALIAFRCTVDAGVQAASLGTNVVLAIGQRAAFDSARVDVRLVSIVEDSRCPSDATCIWAGRVVARLAVGKASQATAEYDVAEGESATTNGFEVTVTKVSPAPTAKRKVAQQDYRVAVKVERRG